MFLRGLNLLIILYFQLKSCINREASIAPASASVKHQSSISQAPIFEAFELLYTFRYTRVGTRHILGPEGKLLVEYSDSSCPLLRAQITLKSLRHH